MHWFLFNKVNFFTNNNEHTTNVFMNLYGKSTKLCLNLEKLLAKSYLIKSFGLYKNNPVNIMRS